MNTLAIGGPCKLCGRPNIEHGHGHCPPAVQWVADGVARVKARLLSDPAAAKALPVHLAPPTPRDANAQQLDTARHW